MRKIFLFLGMCFALLSSATAQQSVTGTVTGEDGLGIPGVSVIESGTSNGTITDIDGVYTISVADDATIVFSFVGMQTVQEPVNGRSTIDVTLVESQIGLEEVVVTALGISKEKKSLGYAVTEVGGDDISVVKDHNPANSLVGKVAGVVVTQGSGSPGSGSRVIIRGNNSITGNNQPLIVVDGVPIDATGSNSGGSVYNSTVTGGGITDINPDDIESISVLKGPNAAALYGSRAGNGVLLITTKKGTKGKGLGVSINSNITFDNPMLLPDYQNEFGQGSQGNVPGNVEDLKNSTGSWGQRLDGSSQMYYTGEERPYSAQSNNVEDFFQTGAKYINSIAIAGAGESHSIRFSYTNNKTESMIPNSDLRSHNFNLRGVVDLNDKLTLDAKATYFWQELNNAANQGSEGILAYVYGMPRNVDIEDLKTYQNPEESLNSISYGALGANPYWILYNDYRTDRRERILGFGKLNYEFTPWLSAFARVGTDVTQMKSESVNQPGHHFYTSGRLTFSNTRVTETNADFLLMFNKDVTPDLNLSVNAGGNHSYRTYEYQSIYGEDFKIPSRATVANTVTQRPSYTPLREKEVNSLYFQASLSYRDFAYLDVTGRNDWSSTLPEDNRSYFYPSVTGSLLLDDFIDPEEDVFNLLKVRASWANVGNDTSPYQLYQYYNLANDGYLGLTQLSRPSTKPNEDLLPENIASFEVGMEGSMFDNRMFFDFSWYNIKTTDQIFSVPVPSSTGFSYFLENIGETSNKGVELLVGGIPVRTGDFSWETSVNFSKNNNKLVELTEDLDSYVYNESNSGNIRLQATVGGGYGDLYGTTWRTNDAGQIVVDANGRPQASTEKEYLGNSQPDWTAGFTNTFTYKDVSLRFLIDARIGGQIYSQTNAALVGSGVVKETLQYREEGIVVDGVVLQDDGSYTQNTTEISAQDYWGSVSGIASEYVFDQTNVRLRELVLSYNVPQSLIRDTFIQGATIGLVGRNLFFIYKDIDHVDPESSLGTGNNGQGILSYNLPTARSIGFNVNIKF
ncbi:SusC/RagA family TonB-linked outer membrane protein [uncultured Draconibacterium sp.]|uniref:SusC/RagA family TonB-linked outer membrane protein n=1 Tax=uncultured Draconibacterium sp. TaxID=1573823 RepID=UPI002AA7CE64|nr:SusC/RagA family TonB-linked outer membrane protein [uncultured Draconibacterium sp.]